MDNGNLLINWQYIITKLEKKIVYHTLRENTHNSYLLHTCWESWSLIGNDLIFVRTWSWSNVFRQWWNGGLLQHYSFVAYLNCSVDHVYDVLFVLIWFYWFGCPFFCSFRKDNFVFGDAFLIILVNYSLT